MSVGKAPPARERAGRSNPPRGPMLDALLRTFLVIGGISAACAWTWPGVFPEADPVAVLVRYHTPNFYTAVVAWYYVAPGVAVFLIGQFLISTSRIWFARMGVSLGLRSRLPAWPLSPTADGPAIVVGEVHHPVRAIESPNPEWLMIPERGLYTGVAIFGAVGSGKTSACMHPFARQLLSWQADNPERRPAALVLEVKGDFCHDIRAILKDVHREGDYIELSLDGRLTWNPLSAPWLDSYSLAYTVASLLNQLFGKGKEPFWQQAYTNLVRWIIELYRVLPHPQDGSATPGWVTLRDVYHCAIDKELFAAKIEEAQTFAADRGDEWITIDAREVRDEAQMFALTAIGFLPHPTRPDRQRAHPDPPVLKRFSDSPCTAWARRGTSACTNAGGPMQAYSMDLRERALLDSDAGMKAADVAVKYRVSGSWVRLLKQRRRETGEVAPRVQRHGRRRMLEPHLHTLAALIAEQPDRTLAELKDALGTPASLATIWRAVAALDVTVKKNGPALRTRST